MEPAVSSIYTIGVTPMTDELGLTPQGEVPEEHSSRADAFKRDLFFYLQNLVYFMLFLILIFTFVGRIIGVDGPSMMPTLHDGDLMILQNICYTPKQGDVVVLTKESFNESPIVKRVIAVGGQTVKIDYDTNTVYVDGVALDEPYIKEAMVDKGSGWTTEVTVPEGSIFVMGDNRNDSSDSRYPLIGTIDERCVIGHVLCVIFPFSDFGVV
ncbi:MAG: Signal peptidase [Oscillospiraceae bacterium]|nr:Signal peptidase [Oscillospiraceae bacterium]